LSTLRDIGEDALIERLIALVPRDPAPGSGPGDDCAVVDQGPEFPRLLLLKTDALVGHVHFLQETPARAVGWKAIARVVSDFAAMGGKPDRFLVTIALPAETEVTWAEDLYRGMGDCLRAFGAVLAGGESSSVPKGSVPVISIAATGFVERSKLVLRSTGKPGDAILVTGLLGGSIHGKHLDFTPRVKESDWLVSKWKPTAMMDVSDGLAKDLPRLAAASGCGFLIDRESVPCTPGVGIDAALGDGEDFELLFTIEPGRVEGLLAEWALVFPGLPLTVVGKLTGVDEGNSLSGGWDHFGNLGLR
jgi:thiamine-monophosphate kinase